jgi:hypothetical protein
LVQIEVSVTAHLFADEPAVIGVTGKISAVAIRDGERCSRRDTLSRDVVGEPIEAESGYNYAAHAAVVAVERQRKMKDLAAGQSADRELSD